MDTISMYFSRQTLVPMLLIGGAVSLVMSFYNGQLLSGINPSSMVNNGIDKVLGMVSMSSSSGVGMYIAKAIHLILSGFLVTGSLILASRARQFGPIRSLAQ